MKEGARGVKRLLRAIYNNADEQTIKELARCLNYNEKQLKEDIEDIQHVTVTDERDD